MHIRTHRVNVREKAKTKHNGLHSSPTDLPSQSSTAAFIIEPVMGEGKHLSLLHTVISRLFTVSHPVRLSAPYLCCFLYKKFLRLRSAAVVALVRSYAYVCLPISEGGYVPCPAEYLQGAKEMYSNTPLPQSNKTMLPPC